MKKEIRDKWCAALRSGEYEQGRGQLRSEDNRYCCLGVLYSILGGEWSDRPRDGSFYPKCGEDGGYLPLKTREGLMSEDIEIELSDKNDHDKKSFSEIADWIEENIPVDEEAPA